MWRDSLRNLGVKIKMGAEKEPTTSCLMTSNSSKSTSQRSNKDKTPERTTRKGPLECTARVMPWGVEQGQVGMIKDLWILPSRISTIRFHREERATTPFLLRSLLPAQGSGTTSRVTPSTRLSRPTDLAQGATTPPWKSLTTPESLLPSSDRDKTILWPRGAR